MKKAKQKLPEGFTPKDIQAILDHYENQTDDEAVAEDEAAFRDGEMTMLQVPTKLVNKVRAMIEREGKTKRAKAA